MIGMVVTYRVRAEDADRAAALLAEMTAEVRAREPGCLHFFALRTEDRPDTFHIAEAYADEAALAAHRETPHFKRLVADGLRQLAVERTAFVGPAVA
jgi:quinol monooxygenase YgiN